MMKNQTGAVRKEISFDSDDRTATVHQSELTKKTKNIKVKCHGPQRGYEITHDEELTRTCQERNFLWW